MRAKTVFGVSVTAFLLGPVLIVGGAWGDPAVPGATPLPSTQDSSVPADGVVPDETDQTPQFADPGENQLATDYQSQQLTTQQFVARGLGAAFGNPVPTSSATGATPPATAAATPAQWDPDFTKYLFAVAGAQAPADQAAFAAAFTPTSADGTEPVSVDLAASSNAAAAPMANLGAATASVAAAAPTSPFCQHPFVAGVPAVFQFVKIRSFSYQCGVGTPHFNIFFTLSSHDANNGVPDADNFGIVQIGTGLVRTTAPDGLPDYIDNVALSMENAFAAYTNMGYKKPPTKIKVLISGLPSSGFTPPPVAGQQFIVLPNQGTEIQIPFHEVFHTFEYRYIALFDLAGYFAQINWWMEASAQWASHHAMLSSGQSLVNTTGVNEEPKYAESLKNYLNDPSKKLDAWAGLAGSRQYGSFILAEYLSGKFGDQAVLRTWQHMGNRNLPVDAIEKTFADYGTTMAVDLPEYAKAVYQLGPDLGCTVNTAAASGCGTTIVCLPDYNGNNPLDNTSGCTGGEYPEVVQGAGFGSNQFQFTDPDLPEWKNDLAVGKTKSDRPSDPARDAPRPFHDIQRINAAGIIRQQTTSIAPGGMAFADVIWNGTTNQPLQITVTAPKTYISGPHGGRQQVPISLHVSMIGWSTYGSRCGYDQESTISKPGSTTVTFGSLAGCTFVTLVLTDLDVQQLGREIHLDYGWSAQLLAVPPVLE